MQSDFIANGLMWYLVFVFSTTCHEAAHAIAAKIGGDETAAEGGQATLNPMPHIQREPLGMVLFPVVSYLMGGWMIGWASVPFDPYWQERHPHRAAWMSLAGPATNLLLMILAALLIHLGISIGALSMPESVKFSHLVDATTPGVWTSVAALLSILFSLNLLLAIFNLIPVPPLDGHSAIGLLMSEQTLRKWHEFMSSPQFSLLGMLVAWKVMDQIFDPLFTLALNVLYPGAGFA